MKLDRVVVDPRVCQGQATIRGTRLTVTFVVKLIASGYTPERVVAEHPPITLEDVQQALSYAAWLASDRTLRLGGA